VWHAMSVKDLMHYNGHSQAGFGRLTFWRRNYFCNFSTSCI